MSGFLYKSLFKSAHVFEDKLSLCFDTGANFSFKNFLNEVYKCINYLKAFSLKKGDIIFAAIGTKIEFCVLVYACNALDIIVVPISTKLKDDGIEHLLVTISPKIIIYDETYQSFIPDLAKKITKSDINCISLRNFIYCNSIAITDTESLSLIDEYDDEATAIIMFTSGTTSSPKGAVISNHNLNAAVLAYEDGLNLHSNDSTILGVPIFHITGLVAILALFVHLGGTIYLEQRFHPNRILELIEKHKISFLHGSPTVFALLHQENMQKQGSSYLSLKSIACGAGRLNRGVINSLKTMFPKSKVHSVYGLTESTSPFTLYRGDVSLLKNADSSGTLVKGAYIKICNDNGDQLPTNTVGTIYIAGDMVIKSYYPVTDSNKRLFSNGFLNTGDVGYIDDNGNLYVKDRVKDIINKGGEKIFCPEVESLISTFDGVVEVALVSKDDDLYGEVPIAYLKVKSAINFDIESLNLFLKRHLPKFQIPVEYQFIDDFPRTNNGKINKRQLRKICNLKA